MHPPKYTLLYFNLQDFKGDLQSYRIQIHSLARSKEILWRNFACEDCLKLLVVDVSSCYQEERKYTCQDNQSV